MMGGVVVSKNCLVYSPADVKGSYKGARWYCTRHHGHSGDHIATVGSYDETRMVLCRWPSTSSDNVPALATSDELLVIRGDREPKYGKHKDNHRNIGLAWAGLLISAGWTPPEQSPVDGVKPEVVEFMMAVLKLVRACNVNSVSFVADNVDDATNYVQMGGEVQREKALAKAKTGAK